jgi:photosystem II stability/assembly factor-like uncharacterized protein
MKKFILSILFIAIVYAGCHDHNREESLDLPTGYWKEIGNLGAAVNMIYQTSNGYVWAGTASGLFLSKNYGQSWQKILSVPNIYDVNENINKTLYVTSDTLYKSFDFGSHWIADTLQLPASPFGNLWGTVTSDAQGHLWAGTFFNGEIFNSTDNGNSWIQKTGIGVLNFLRTDSKGNVYAAGSGVKKSTDNGQTWTYTGYSYHTGFFLLIVNDSLMIVSDGEYELNRTSDAGTTWNRIEFVHTSRRENYTIFGLGGYTLAFEDSTIFTADYNEGVFISKDLGQNWAAFYDSLPTNEACYAIAHLKDHSLLVGTNTGRIFGRRE